MKKQNQLHFILLFCSMLFVSVFIAQNNENKVSPSFEDIEEIELAVKQTSKDVKNSAKTLNNLGKTIEEIKSSTKKEAKSFLDVKLYDDDFIKLSFRFLLNLIAILLIARVIYYPLAKRKDYLFTYIMISILVFFICFTLKKFELGLGMALGLFAIFGIIRYRTDPIPIKEMTYLFIVIGISVINALANKKMSYSELLLTNSVIIFATYGMERLWLLKHESRKVIIYEKIDLIVPENHSLLKEDLEKRTGLKITRFEIGKINFLNDTAQIFIHYYADEQDSKFIDEGLGSE
ncbi:MAG: DUF4956 domain-containing protein [Flavobacteriales bacterium]|nr:DUF4956 domain-containing protein [Flavobacteriales bacterium]